MGDRRDRADTDDESGADGSRKRPVGGELIVPVGAIVFTLYYITTILHGPWEAKANAYYIGSTLMALCALFILRTLLAVRRGEATLGLQRLIEPRNLMVKRLGLLALTVGYIYVVHWGGFTLTTFVFLAASILLLRDGRDRGFVLALSAALALGGYLLFIVAFHTRFPKGPFEILMQQVF